VANAQWQTGISSSIRAGIAAVDSRSEAALFVLGDQPRLSGSMMDAILLAYYGGTRPIVVPTHSGCRGNPVLFDRALFPALQCLVGDTGGQQLLSVMPERILTVEVADAGLFLDIDVPADLERYEERVEEKDSQ
jgi:molybdenum cofactor cytidylyltransferase